MIFSDADIKQVLLHRQFVCVEKFEYDQQNFNKTQIENSKLICSKIKLIMLSIGFHLCIELTV